MIKNISMPVLLTALLLFQQSGYSDKQSRIISLDLCTDWMLLKLADRSQVLAYSPLLYRYPVNWIPEGLPVHDGSLEQILQLGPDLVLTGEYNAIILRKRLQQLDINVDVMPLPLSLQSIRQYQQHFHKVVSNKDVVSIAIEPFTAKNKRLLLLGANGIGTGQGTLEHEVIKKAGWNNYLQHQGYVNLDLEQLVNDPPDAVLWSSPVSSSLANLFAQHAVFNRLIDQQSWIRHDDWRWQCPGPWTYELIRELALWKKP